MSKSDCVRKTKQLCILWAVSMGVLAILAIVFITYGYVNNLQPAPLEPLSAYQIALTVILLTYLCPLLLRIHYWAKQACNKPIQIISLVFLIHHSLFAIMSLAEMIFLRFQTS